MKARPALSFRQIWNMCFGFFGIQFGFALQTAEVSRIFQTLGASLEQIPVLWVAAPVTGLLVQPVVGHLSDRTWTRLGRRRPYFLAGALLAALSLLWMPNAATLWTAAALLWLMDASINVSMEPFRAFVGDQLPPAQRPLGYAVQGFFIALGAVVASAMPWLLARCGVANAAPPGGIPDTVRYAFYAGGAALLGAVLWTVASTREYPPGQLLAFDPAPAGGDRPSPAGAARNGIAWALAGALGTALVWRFALQRELYLLSVGMLAYGALLLWLARTRRRNLLAQVLGDLHAMPEAMRRLAWVQLFSWFALFALWIYATAAVTAVHFGSADPHSAAYNEGANWVGVLFAAYNGFAALAAITIPWMVRRWGLQASHLANLWLGGAGLLSFLLIRDPHWLLLPMLGVGFAWASILSLPYAMLSDSLPAAKMGVYMGIFNFFIVIPQLVAASVLGALLRLFFHGQAVWALALGGASLFAAGLCTLRVRLEESPAMG
ncbi:MFS transporter [Fulvimonas soli]|uniref:Maltose/moltooligosaccharide transporter n=1 Tax=Fulvimonas soli TaxID=155197 RepID=A0A316IGK2_9GAMM|nr:MFS transporter [Fulvimonas soli]PWK92441.1 maltose/moltooligosaccharide transporter [Fulvimonas soli]TNY26261.1 MFS transporter [Fulvimonas soli]